MFPRSAPADRQHQAQVAVAELLDRVEDESGPTMAHSTLAIVRRIMGWHATRDEDYSSPIVRGMGRIKPKERARQAILR